MIIKISHARGNQPGLRCVRISKAVKGSKTWTFNVIDQWAADNGTLYGWGMDFNPNIVPGVTTFTPVIGAESDSSFWNVTAFDEGVVLISEDGNYVDLEFPNPGDFDFTYEVTNNFGCTWDTTVNITVIEGPQSSITAGSDLIFCQDPVQLQGDFSGTDPSPCATFWWFIRILLRR